MEFQKNLAKNLKMIREVEQLSQSDFAKRLGITKSTYQAIEQQKTSMRLDTLEVISSSLGLSPGILLSSEFNSNQLGILTTLIRHLDYFDKLRPEDQKALLDLISEMVTLLSCLTVFSGDT